MRRSIVTDEHTICVICAWRGDCVKKFSFQSHGVTKCPDFSRDVTIKEPPARHKDEDQDQ
jgi:hypothetical protein